MRGGWQLERPGVLVHLSGDKISVQDNGGKPIATVDATEIIGTQWQLECRSGSTCTVDITIDNVTFY